jgi:hypothetical protein
MKPIGKKSLTLLSMNFCRMLMLLLLSTMNLLAASQSSGKERMPEMFGNVRIKANNPISFVPDYLTADKAGWSQAYVFSAHNINGKRFDLYCQKVNAKELLPLEGLTAEKFGGECIVTGVTSVAISQTPLFYDGFILDCATKVDEYGRFFMCKLHLLYVNGGRFKVDSFADRANRANLIADEIVESALLGKSESNEVARIQVYARTKAIGHYDQKWLMALLDVDLNRFRMVSERVARTFTNLSFTGGIYLSP